MTRAIRFNLSAAFLFHSGSSTGSAPRGYLSPCSLRESARRSTHKWDLIQKHHCTGDSHTPQLPAPLSALLQSFRLRRFTAAGNGKEPEGVVVKRAAAQEKRRVAQEATAAADAEAEAVEAAEAVPATLSLFLCWLFTQVCSEMKHRARHPDRC